MITRIYVGRYSPRYFFRLVRLPDFSDESDADVEDNHDDLSPQSSDEEILLNIQQGDVQPAIDENFPQNMEADEQSNDDLTAQSGDDLIASSSSDEEDIFDMRRFLESLPQDSAGVVNI